MTEAMESDVDGVVAAFWDNLCDADRARADRAIEAARAWALSVKQD